MNKENKEKTSEWISELGELVPIKFNKKHKAFLNKSPIDLKNFVRKPYRGKK